jgi:hypothetical protein
VLTRPFAIVFGFLAQPGRHLFYTPRVMQRPAAAYGYALPCRSRPSWEGYQALLDFADCLADELADLDPGDYIDLQSFLWVLGSDEYPD